jgi:hypothetical protein
LCCSVEKDLREIETAGEPLDIDQFRLFTKSHQALLFPAFQMQSALQRKVLGHSFWEKNAERRIKFSNGQYVSIGNFILMVCLAAKRLCSPFMPWVPLTARPFSFHSSFLLQNMSKEKAAQQGSDWRDMPGSSKKGLGDMQLKTAQEHHGGAHVTKLMEVTGSKGAQKQSVQRNERK